MSKSSLTLDGAIRYAEIIAEEIDKADIIKKNSNEGFLVGFRFYIEGNSLS